MGAAGGKVGGREEGEEGKKGRREGQGEEKGRNEGGRRAAEKERKTIWAGQWTNQGEDESDAMLMPPKKAVRLA